MYKPSPTISRNKQNHVMTQVPQGKNRIRQREAHATYPPAYFLSLEVENVLCFKTRQKLDLSNTNGLHAQWTVILGDNGVGKTTLLRCLAGMEPRPRQESVPLGSEVRIWSFPRFRSFETALESIKSLQDSRVNIVATFSVSSNFNSEIDTIQESLYFSRTPLNTDAHFKAISSSTSSDEKLLGLKCYGYGANRIIGKTSLGETLSSDGCASLFSEDITLINAEEWLLQTDYAVARSTPENKALLEQRLHLIQDILKKILPDISDIRISPVDDKHPRPTAEFLTPYDWVPLKSLSLGYKTVIAWMVDLAARLMDRYPDSEDPLAEPAVVLVDEIDLHLHPKWQRTIMSFLTERFPNTQFIVTAHSPLVVQAAKDANIVLLRREGDHVVIDNDPEIIDNWRVDQVLTSIFELPTPRPPDVEPLIERRRVLLSKSKLTAKDQRELKDLEAKIGSLPTAESPEDIRAMDIIRKAAKLLENS
jgi:predicted ATP-binding protein involved in virulence